MDVFSEIIQKSALGIMSRPYKAATLLLFSAIVTMLMTMLVILLIHGPAMVIRFGY
ncbi:hypothetical protein ACEZ3G_10205 [Maribacter algicola]|uniref:Uncharacterized protein n=1 Tax=Meishania litoralis TaxID=3434685 RepID=A0ACC7LK15_9FLAO